MSKETSDFDREHSDFEGAVDAISNIPVFRSSAVPFFQPPTAAPNLFILFIYTYNQVPHGPEPSAGYLAPIQYSWFFCVFFCWPCVFFELLVAVIVFACFCLGFCWPLDPQSHENPFKTP